MGVSTVASYTGAQIFEALGLSQEVIDDCFTGTTLPARRRRPRRAGREAAARHADGLPARGRPRTGGCRSAAKYQWRRGGRVAPVQPRDGLQAAARATQDAAARSSRSTPAWWTPRPSGLVTLRGLFELPRGGRRRCPIEEVEPVSEIVKRFSTGAMSLRLDLDGGARDARHRDEPPRRQVQHAARAARTPTRLLRRRPAAARSSRWRPAGSG